MQDSTPLEEVYKRLYPETVFEKYAEQGFRPGGRPLAGERKIAANLEQVKAPAITKVTLTLGNTMVLAGRLLIVLHGCALIWFADAWLQVQGL